MSNTSVVVLLIILIIGGIFIYNNIQKETDQDIGIDNENIDMWIDIYDENGNYVKTVYPSDNPFMAVHNEK